MRLDYRDPLSGRRIAATRRFAPVVSAPVDPDGIDRSPVPSSDDPATVLAWVGYDPDRAKAALVAELSRDHPNTDLLARIQERTTG